MNLSTKIFFVKMKVRELKNIFYNFFSIIALSLFVWRSIKKDYFVFQISTRQNFALNERRVREKKKLYCLHAKNISPHFFIHKSRRTTHDSARLYIFIYWLFLLFFLLSLKIIFNSNRNLMWVRKVFINYFITLSGM